MALGSFVSRLGRSQVRLSGLTVMWERLTCTGCRRLGRMAFLIGTPCCLLDSPQIGFGKRTAGKGDRRMGAWSVLVESRCQVVLGPLEMALLHCQHPTQHVQVGPFALEKAGQQQKLHPVFPFVASQEPGQRRLWRGSQPNLRGQCQREAALYDLMALALLGLHLCHNL